MKNKAVEAMVRVQFNIPDDVEVEVEFLYYENKKHSFCVQWVDKNDEPCIYYISMPSFKKAKNLTIGGSFWE